jgi:hypothetical protein
MAHAEASPYCFGPAKSAVAGFSQTSLMFSFLKMLSSPHAVTKCGVAAGRLLLWADSLPHCTGSFVPARHAETSQILASTKCRRPAKISLNLKSQPLKTTVHVKLYFFHTRLHLIPSYSTCYSHKTTSRPHLAIAHPQLVNNQHPIRTHAKNTGAAK